MIPTYNCARFLEKTLQSVLGQTLAAKEIIVVDDGSTDNTREVIEPFLDRVHYVHQTNRGLPARSACPMTSMNTEQLSLERSLDKRRTILTAELKRSRINSSRRGRIARFTLL